MGWAKAGHSRSERRRGKIPAPNKTCGGRCRGQVSRDARTGLEEQQLVEARGEEHGGGLVDRAQHRAARLAQPLDRDHHLVRRTRVQAWGGIRGKRGGMRRDREGTIREEETRTRGRLFNVHRGQQPQHTQGHKQGIGQPRGMKRLGSQSRCEGPESVMAWGPRTSSRKSRLGFAQSSCRDDSTGTGTGTRSHIEQSETMYKVIVSCPGLVPTRLWHVGHGPRRW